MCGISSKSKRMGVSVQVVPVVSLNGNQSQPNGRQLGTPTPWPYPGDPHHHDDDDPRLTGYTVDASLGNGPYSTAVTIVGGRRRLASAAGRLRGALSAQRTSRRLLSDAEAATPAAPAMAPMRKPAVKPGEAQFHMKKESSMHAQ